MSYNFQEILAYHPANETIFGELRDLLPRLVPFVGAGLTQFAYYSWPDALRELSGRLANKKNQQAVNKLIREGRYLDAAQELENLCAPINLAHNLADIFSADRLERNRDKLSREPIALLPCLFPELVLTTNFDETLETVYRESEHPFEAVLLPGHPELLGQFLLKGGSGLFKLHGTLSGRHIEYGQIVFTQTQYNKFYGEGSSLRKDLKDCFEKRIMLFLGCSLENDRTVDLLQEVIQPGHDYYTIIGCKESERDEKAKKLGDKNIRALLYRQGRHEAVRVILEQLLNETVRDHDLRATAPVHFRHIDKAEKKQPQQFQTLMEVFKKRLEVTFHNSGDYHLGKITTQLYPDLKNNIYETSFQAENTDTDTSLWICLEKDWQESARSHYMLTGAGGCGKTVAMRQTARLLLDHGILAVYIPMHELKHEKGSIEKYIRQYILHRDQTLWKTLYQTCYGGMTGGTPSLVLFLDGWNEVREGKVGQDWFTDTLREELEHMWMTLPGIQIVLAGRERADKSIGWNSLLSYLEVMPLQKFKIKFYLNTCGIELPEEKDSIWQTISNPLMLVLYVNTVGQKGQFGNLSGITFISGEKHSSQAAVIWNFLQCQVGKFVCLKTGNPYSYFIAINYAASWIGWRMEQDQRYTLTRGELIGLLDEAGKNYSLWWSEGTYLANMRKRLSAADWQWNTEELRHILCDETSLLYCGTPEEDRDASAHEIFHFIHQKFRDCYAAIYMRSQLSPYGVKETPESCHSWRAFAANAEILDLLHTFFSPARLDELWFHQKDVIADDNSFAMFHLLELYQRAGTDISRLDFSRLDLRFVSLQNRNLHTNGICFRGAMISNRTLRAQNHTGTISSIAWLPARKHESNDYFLSAGRDLRLWNIRTGELQSCWQDHDSGITCVAASRDGSRFATTSHDKKLLIYLVSQPDAPSGFYTADKVLTAVSFSPAGSLLAIGNESGEVILCSSEGIFLKDVPCHEIASEKSVKMLCFDDSGRYLSGLTADKVLALWELTPNSEPLLLWHQKIAGTVLDMNFDRHGTALLYVLETGAVFRLATDTCEHKLLWEQEGVLWKAAALSRDSQQLAVLRENELKLLHTFNGREYKAPLFSSDDRDTVDNFLAFSIDGRKILYGSGHCSLFVWNAEQPMTEAEYVQPPLCAVKNSDQRLEKFVLLTENIFLCAFGDGYLTWWDIGRRRCFRREKLLDVAISYMALSPDKKILVTVGSDHTLFLRDMETLRRYPQKAELPDTVREIVFSPDGTILCCACDDFHVYGWHMPDFNPLFSIALEKEIRILSMAFLPDGSLLGGSTTGKIYRWKMPEATELEWPVVHNDLVVALKLSVNGRFMISLSQDGYLYYWQLDHLRCFGHWKLNAASCLWHCVDLSDDGCYILAGKVVPSGENELYFWELNLHENKVEVVKGQHIPLTSMGIRQILFFSSNSKVLCSTLEGNLYISDTDRLAIENPIQMLPDIHLVNADFRRAYFEDLELMELARMSGGITEDACLY